MAIFKFAGAYEFLDLFYECDVELDGMVYPSAASAFAVIRLEDKDEELVQLCMQNNVDVIKYIIEEMIDGQMVKADFALNMYKYLYKVIKAKFTNKELAKSLISTGDNQIIWLSKDQYLGIKNGDGDNLLGKALMNVRNDL